MRVRSAILASALASAIAITNGAFAQPPADAPMVAIPGGAYPMGSDVGPASVRPTHRVTLRPSSSMHMR